MINTSPYGVTLWETNKNDSQRRRAWPACCSPRFSGLLLPLSALVRDENPSRNAAHDSGPGRIPHYLCRRCLWVRPVLMAWRLKHSNHFLLHMKGEIFQIVSLCTPQTFTHMDFEICEHVRAFSSSRAHVIERVKVCCYYQEKFAIQRTISISATKESNLGSKCYILCMLIYSAVTELACSAKQLVNQFALRTLKTAWH